MHTIEQTPARTITPFPASTARATRHQSADAKNIQQLHDTIRQLTQRILHIEHTLAGKLDKLPTSKTDIAAHVEQILLRVAREHKLRVSDLTGPHRWSNYVWPQHKAIYAIAKITGAEPHTIAPYFQRHEGSIQYALKNVQNRLDLYPAETKPQIDHLLAQFQTQTA